MTTIKVGIYVDAENVLRCGGHGLRYDTLLDFILGQPGAVLQRACIYQGVDKERIQAEDSYRTSVHGFQRALRDGGWKIVEKPVRWFLQEDGSKIYKANADIDMAVDILTQARNLDRIVLVTGDGDFTALVEELQNQGKRVEVLSFLNTALELQQSADQYYSGYLIPGLLPIRDAPVVPWGEPGSRIRGSCVHWDAAAHYGFIRFMRLESGRALHLSDSRHPNSPYQSAFVAGSEIPKTFPQQYLAQRQAILEFDLLESDRDPDSFVARNCTVITSRYAA